MFPTVKLLWQAAGIIGHQQRQLTRIEAEKRDLELSYQRICRDLIEQFLIALDTPENHDPIRARLTTALGFYRDEIAVREEQVG